MSTTKPTVLIAVFMFILGPLLYAQGEYFVYVTAATVEAETEVITKDISAPLRQKGCNAARLLTFKNTIQEYLVDTGNNHVPFYIEIQHSGCSIMSIGGRKKFQEGRSYFHVVYQEETKEYEGTTPKSNKLLATEIQSDGRWQAYGPYQVSEYFSTENEALSSLFFEKQDLSFLKAEGRFRFYEIKVAVDHQSISVDDIIQSKGVVPPPIKISGEGQKLKKHSLIKHYDGMTTRMIFLKSTDAKPQIFTQITNTTSNQKLTVLMRMGDGSVKKETLPPGGTINKSHETNKIDFQYLMEEYNAEDASIEVEIMNFIKGKVWEIITIDQDQIKVKQESPVGGSRG